MALSSRLLSISVSISRLPCTVTGWSSASRPRSMRRAQACGSQSLTTSRASAHRSSSPMPPAPARFSMRASDSSCVTRCAVRSELPAICASERRSSSGDCSRCASSACMRSPASGVFIWCAASAIKRFCVCTDWSSCASRSLNDPTSGVISCGAARSSMGLVSPGLRARMRCWIAVSGASPRESPNHTSTTASGRITNWGRITPLMISLARRARLSSVSATCTSTGWLPLTWRRST
ncbi:hypothetical protein D3C81_1377160 [compost metagenome]